MFKLLTIIIGISLFISTLISCRGSYDPSGHPYDSKQLTIEKVQQKNKDFQSTEWKLPTEFDRQIKSGCQISFEIPAKDQVLDFTSLKSKVNSFVFMWKAEGAECSGEYIFRFFGNDTGETLKLTADMDKTFGFVSKTQGVFYWNQLTMEDVLVKPNPEGRVYWNVEDLGTGAQSAPQYFLVK